MFSIMIAMAANLAAAQASDTTREAREGFTACLRGFVEKSAEAKLPAAQFETDYPAACAAEEAAFRNAVIRRETGMRASRADAEQAAKDEVEDARVNFTELFAMLTEDK